MLHESYVGSYRDVYIEVSRRLLEIMGCHAKRYMYITRSPKACTLNGMWDIRVLGLGSRTLDLLAGCYG